MTHKHSVYDTDKHFIVDAITRKITSQSKKTKLMRYDHNSERFTFQVPRYIDGHDMSLCDTIDIHYINLSADTLYQSTGPYPVSDMQISPDSEDVIIFSWLISGNATMYAGTLSFAISFKCHTDDVIDYAWHTDAFTGVDIVDTIYVDSSDVVLEYHDIIAQWKNDIFGEGDSAVQRIKDAEEAAIKAIEDRADSIVSGGDTGSVDLTGYAKETWVEELLEDYQPKGDYLTKVPEGYATESYVQEQIAQAELGGSETGGSVDLSNYALKTELPTKVSQLSNDAGYVKEEDIPNALSDLTDDASHRTVTDEEKETWNNKSGFSGNYEDLTNKPTIPSKTSDLSNDSGFLTQHQSLEGYAKEEDIPTKTSDLTNDSGFLTEHQSLEGYATEDFVKAKIAEAELGGESGEIDLSGYALRSELPTKTSQLTNDSGFLTEHQSLESYAKTEDIPTKTSDLTNDSGFLTQHQSLESYAKTEDIPTKTSDLTNDSGFLTQHQSLEGYAKTEDIPTKTSDLTNDSGFLTQHQSLEGYAKTEDIPAELSELTDDASHRTVTDAEKESWNSKSEFSGSYEDLTEKPTLFSGKYEDLSGKPTIPSKTSDLTNDSGFLTEHQSLEGYAKEEDVPTELSELTDDAAHRTVTDAEKESWNAKSEFSGSYEDLTEKPALFSGDYEDLTNKPSIPTKTSDLTNDSGFLTQHQSLEGYAKEDDIPTALADLTTDETHRTVTDAEKESWNAKSEFSGNWADLDGRPIVVTVDNSWNTSMSAAEIIAAKNSGTIVILNCGILLAEVSASDNSDSPEYVDFSTILCADAQLMKLTVRVTGSTAAPSFSNITADSIGLTPFSGSYNDLTDKPTIPSAYSHPSTHSASMISAGTFAGPVVANSSGQAPGTSLIRNIKLVAEEATPTVNGEIFFVYG